MIWKRYKDTNYEVSSAGHVRNAKTGIVRKQSLGGTSKYYLVSFRENGSLKNHLVHRLVAECFVEKVEGKDFVNHKDGNKLNNDYTNLEWCTRSENNKHAYDTGLKKYRPLHYKGKTGFNHNRSKAVKVVGTDLVFGSRSEAARHLNIDHSSISWSIKYNRPIKGMHFETGI